MARRTDPLDLSPKHSQGEGRAVDEKGEEFGPQTPQRGLSGPGFANQTWGPGLPALLGRLAHHPEEARPVLGHVQLWIHGLQEPLEALTLELGAKLPPLCHVSKGLLGKQQNSEPLKAMALLIKALLPTAAHSLTELLLSTYCVLGPKQPQTQWSAPEGEAVAQSHAQVLFLQGGVARRTGKDTKHLLVG